MADLNSMKLPPEGTRDRSDQPEDRLNSDIDQSKARHRLRIELEQRRTDVMAYKRALKQRKGLGLAVLTDLAWIDHCLKEFSTGDCDRPGGKRSGRK